MNKLIDLNFRLLSFLDTVIQNENDSMTRGNHIYTKYLFNCEFENILKTIHQNPEQPETIHVVRPIRTKRYFVGGDNDKFNYLSDNETNTDNHDEEISLVMDDVEDDPIIEVDSLHLSSLKTTTPVTAKPNLGCKPTFDLPVKKQSAGGKKVQITEPEKPITSTKYLEDKLDCMNAEHVKKIGKRVGIKPGKRKKNLTKKETIARIVNNKKMRAKVYDMVKSDSESNS